VAKKTDIFYPDRIVGGRFVTSTVKALMNDLEDQQVEVCIRPRRRHTSLPQMRFYRGWVIRLTAERMRDLGTVGPRGAPITDEEVHQMMAGRFLRRTVFVDPDTGECMDVTMSTTQLTTVEMNEYIVSIMKWALDVLSIEIPDPVKAGDTRIA
jgi:hypothetical protein